MFANNHRARCRISPVNVLDVYNPRHEQFKDIYLVEKISSNEGLDSGIARGRLEFGVRAGVAELHRVHSREADAGERFGTGVRRDVDHLWGVCVGGGDGERGGGEEQDRILRQISATHGAAQTLSRAQLSCCSETEYLRRSKPLF